MVHVILSCARLVYVHMPKSSEEGSTCIGIKARSRRAAQTSETKRRRLLCLLAGLGSHDSLLLLRHHHHHALRWEMETHRMDNGGGRSSHRTPSRYSTGSLPSGPTTTTPQHPQLTRVRGGGGHRASYSPSSSTAHNDHDPFSTPKAAHRAATTTTTTATTMGSSGRGRSSGHPPTPAAGTPRTRKGGVRIMKSNRKSWFKRYVKQLGREREIEIEREMKGGGATGVSSHDASSKLVGSTN